MILGEKKEELTSENVLKHISPYDIFRYYLGNFEIGEVFCNPMRKEKNPSMQVNMTHDGLLFLDYGDSFYRGNCFHLVQKYYRCDYNKALEHIDNDFNLGIRNSKIEKSNIITWNAPKELKVTKLPPVIHIKTKKFNKDELKWWNLYYQDISDLKRENIHAPKEIWINGKRQTIKASDLIFCYFYPKIGRWKIYTPTAEDKKLRWFSNVPFNYCDGLENINGCRIGYLEKSKKDSMVLQKALSTTCVANIQAENEYSISTEALEHFDKNCEIKVAVMDSDEVGKRVSRFLTSQHGYVHCNVPDKYLKSNANDFAALAHKYGLEKVTDHFRSKNLLP